MPFFSAVGSSMHCTFRYGTLVSVSDVSATELLPNAIFVCVYVQIAHRMLLIYRSYWHFYWNLYSFSQWEFFVLLAVTSLFIHRHSFVHCAIDHDSSKKNFVTSMVCTLLPPTIFSFNILLSLLSHFFLIRFFLSVHLGNVAHSLTVCYYQFVYCSFTIIIFSGSVTHVVMSSTRLFLWIIFFCFTPKVDQILSFFWFGAEDRNQSIKPVCMLPFFLSVCRFLFHLKSRTIFGPHILSFKSFVFLLPFSSDGGALSYLLRMKGKKETKTERRFFVGSHSFTLLHPHELVKWDREW